MKLVVGFSIALLALCSIYSVETKGHGGRGGHGRGGGHGHGGHGGHGSSGGHSVSSGGSHSSGSGSSSSSGSSGGSHSSGGSYGGSSGGSHSSGGYDGGHSSGGYGGSHSSGGSGGSYSSGGYGGSHSSGGYDGGYSSGGYGGSHSSGGSGGSHSSDPYGGSHSSGSYGGSHSDPFGGSHSDPFGGSHSNPFGESHSNPFGGGHSNPFGGSHSDPFGGGHSNPFGGSHSDPFGGSRTDPFGGSRSDPFGGIHSDPFGGIHSDPFGGSHSGSYGGKHNGGYDGDSYSSGIFSGTSSGRHSDDNGGYHYPGSGMDSKDNPFRNPFDDYSVPEFGSRKRPGHRTEQDGLNELFPDLKIPNFDDIQYKPGGGIRIPGLDDSGFDSHRGSIFGSKSNPTHADKPTDHKTNPSSASTSGDDMGLNTDSHPSIGTGRIHRHRNRHGNKHGHGSNSTTTTPRPDNSTTISPSSSPSPPRLGQTDPSSRLETPMAPPHHSVPLKTSNVPHPAQSGYGYPLGHPSGIHHPGISDYGQPLTPGSPTAHQPIVPGQIIVLPNRSNPSSDLGQIAAEAFVHSTINAGVHRLINGPSHQHIVSSNENGQSSTVTNNTTIIYNNYKPNGQPQEVSGQGTNPAGVHIGNRNSESNLTADNVSAPTVQYYISDDELMNLTESLFAKEEANLYQHVILDLQSKVKEGNVTDEASRVLLYTNPELYEVPTIQVFKNMFDNYELNATIKENTTSEMRKEQHLLLDTFFNTDIMTTAMNWLASKYYIESDDFEMKDTLRHIWFNKIKGSTSGFERIFLAEVYPGSGVLGAQNWIYFMSKETSKDIDYMGYTEEHRITDRAQLLKLNLKIGNSVKENSTMLVGTSPELEMALYTICFYTRPNDICPVSLGGHKFYLYTHTFRYFGNDLIDIGIIAF